MPYLTQSYLIKGSVLRSKLSQVSLYVNEGMDPDMVFCSSIRDQVHHGGYVYILSRCILIHVSMVTSSCHTVM